MKMALYGASSGKDVYYDTDSIKAIDKTEVYKLSKTKLSSLYGKIVMPSFVYMVNVYDFTEHWECYELGFSNIYELVRFMKSVSPKATITRRQLSTYMNEPHVHHIHVKELHTDGTEVVFDISKIYLDYEYVGMRYRRSY